MPTKRAGGWPEEGANGRGTTTVVAGAGDFPCPRSMLLPIEWNDVGYFTDETGTQRYDTKNSPLPRAILRRLLLRLLTGAESIRHSGLLNQCVVPRVVQIKAELDIMLTDGDGLQYALEWNGPNALRPTFNLANVYMLGSRLDGAGYVDISCSDWVQFRQWTIAEVLAIVDGVLAQR